ncbi:MAG: membrane protein required for beta-lactamase induction [Gammaproteobacteria bacterium]|jgi:membrane protein required for beta-lactamase induction|tara:strand:- start:603 stop:1442 length:840 start_codon:yes stop_codon:yes gene_type:complete
MITALLIFFALILEYVYDPVSNMKNTAVIDATFEKFRNLVNNYIDNKYYVYLLFPISIIIIYSIMIYITDNYLHEFFSFIINLIVLVYCLKPSEFNSKIEDLKILQDNKEGDQRFDYVLSSHNNKDLIDNIFYNSTRSIFTVFFCFLVLGPSGSLAFIILDNYIYSKEIKIDQKSKKGLKNIISIIEYIPVRLCSFAFAVVANFELCSRAWKSSKKEKSLYDLNIKLINTVGISSYSEPENDSGNNREDKIIFIQSIIYRTFLSWLSLTGFLIISGIFV